MSGFLATLSPTPGAQVEAIYVAYYGRAADGGGYIYWETDAAALIGAGLTGDQAGVQIADVFAEQTESKANYSFLLSPPLVLDPTNATQIAQVDEFINQVYANLFNRTAEQAGLLYWQNAILKGQVSVGEAVYAIANGATNTAAYDDATVLGFKVAAALNFTHDTNGAGYGNSLTTPPAIGSDFIAAATAIIQPVVDATTAATAATETTGFIANGGKWPLPVITPVTTTLTVGPDVVLASDGQTINGYVNTHNNTSTFQTADVINGGANSTLNITDYAHLNTPITATVSDVGVINHTLLASNTYDEALYSSVGQEWIKSDPTAAGGNTLTVTNAQAATVYGIETNNVDSLNLSYATTKVTAQIALGGTKKGSTVTLANATGVDFATTGSNTIAFTGGTSLTSFVVTGDGTNSFDLTGAGAVATSGLTVDTSASTGADLVDLGGNWNANDPIKGNGDTTLGILLKTTTPLPTVPWTGVSALQLDTGSLGNLFLTGVTGLSTVIYESNPGDNNVVLNNVVGVNSLIFKGDGTSGSQQFGSIWLNGDTSPTLNITFQNAVPLLISSDVTIGTWGHSGDGIVADGVATVTIDTTGVLGVAGDFILGGGFTDNALQSLTLISNAENNWIDTVSTRAKETLLKFDASKATGNLTVRFEDGAFGNGAVVTGAVGTNHVTIEDNVNAQNQPITVFVNLGNGGRAGGHVGLWDLASLTWNPAYELKSDEYYSWQVFNGADSNDNFVINAGNGDNLIFTGRGSDIVNVGYGTNIIDVGGQSEDINGGVQQVNLAAHPEGQDTILIKNSNASTVDITGLNGGGAHNDVVWVLENAYSHHFETTVDLGAHTSPAEIDAVETGSGSVLNLNNFIGDTLNIWTDAFAFNQSDRDTFKHTYNLDAGHPAGTININQSHLIGGSDYFNLDVFSGLNGDTINISLNNPGIAGQETVDLGSHTVGSDIYIGSQPNGDSVILEHVIAADLITLQQTGDVVTIAASGVVADVVVNGDVHSLTTYDSANIALNNSVTQSDSFSLQSFNYAFTGTGQHGNAVIYTQSAAVAGPNYLVGAGYTLQGQQTIDLGQHTNGSDTITLYQNTGDPTADVLLTNARTLDKLVFTDATTPLAHILDLTLVSPDAAHFVSAALALGAVNTVYEATIGGNTYFYDQHTAHSSVGATVVELIGTTHLGGSVATNTLVLA